MKRLILSFLLMLTTSVAFAQDGEVPQGQLTYFEFTTTYHDGKFLSQRSRATLADDGKVSVTCYDYYGNFDSCTVFAGKEVLDHICSVIESHAKRHSMNKDVTWLNGESGYGQTHHFVAEFEGGGRLAMNGYIANYGMRDIQRYLRNVCETEVKKQPLLEIKEGAGADVYWHAGGRFATQEELRNTYGKTCRINRYSLGGKEFLTLRSRKTGRLQDIYVRLKKKGNIVEEIQQAYIALISGIYQNETGKSAFGTVKFSKEEISKGGYSGGDPGAELEFLTQVKYGHVTLSDELLWGHGRIKERNDAPADAPPGWGGHGAIAGPTKWTVRFTDAGLACEELEAPMYCDTYPAFGKKFVLKKIRGPYQDTQDPWAVASEELLVRDLLMKLAPRQLRAILAELKARHADGSALTPLEKLNQELVQSVLNKKTT